MTSQFRHVVCDVRARYALQCPLLKGLKFSSIFLHRVLCSIGILATDRDAKLRPPSDVRVTGVTTYRMQVGYENIVIFD